MRRILNSFVILALLLGGCQNNVGGVKTLLTVAESVNSAMNVYGEMARAGALTEEQKTNVRTKHAKYQVAFNAAVALVAQDLSKLSPAEVANLAADVITLIYQLKATNPIP